MSQGLKMLHEGSRGGPDVRSKVPSFYGVPKNLTVADRPKIYVHVTSRVPGPASGVPCLYLLYWSKKTPLTTNHL